jgi:hypothetical protein
MRLALAVVVLVGCRQIFGLHELSDKKDDGGSGATDGRIDTPSDGTGDGPTDAKLDAPLDSGSAGRPAGVQCGSGSACDPHSVLNNVCCSSSTVLACMTSACGAGQAALSCDDAADCATGSFCCATYDSTGTVMSSACVVDGSQCSAQPGGGIEFFCDPNAAQPCPMGFTHCTAPSTLLSLPPGYYYCQ